VPDAGTWDGANEQLSRVIDAHSLHLAGSGVRPAGADIDVTSRITSAPGSGEPRNACSSALCLIMPVIEAQRVSKWCLTITGISTMSTCRSRRPAWPSTPLVERHGRCRSQESSCRLCPYRLPCQRATGPCKESPASDLLWRLAAGIALWGFNSVSWGFNSATKSSRPVCEAAAAVRELPGSSGRMSPCFPDDQA